MAGAVHRVKLDEQEVGLLGLDVLADAVAQTVIVTGVLGGLIVVNQTVVDGVPVGEATQNGIRHGLTDDAVQGGMLVGSQRVGGGPQLVVVDTVDLGGYAHEHGGPALTGVGGNSGQAVVTGVALGHEAADVGGAVLVLEIESAGAVDTYDDYVLISECHDIVLFSIFFMSEPFCHKGRR
jgi:hypothetical protein